MSTLVARLRVSKRSLGSTCPWPRQCWWTKQGPNWFWTSAQAKFQSGQALQQFKTNQFCLFECLSSELLIHCLLFEGYVKGTAFLLWGRRRVTSPWATAAFRQHALWRWDWISSTGCLLVFCEEVQASLLWLLGSGSISVALEVFPPSIVTGIRILHMLNMSWATSPTVLKPLFSSSWNLISFFTRLHLWIHCLSLTQLCAQNVRHSFCPFWIICGVFGMSPWASLSRDEKFQALRLLYPRG